MATEWQHCFTLLEVNLQDIERMTHSKSSRSGTSSSSKQSRKEKMAFAQLKLEQVRRRQDIEREEHELRMRKRFGRCNHNSRERPRQGVPRCRSW